MYYDCCANITPTGMTLPGLVVTSSLQPTMPQ